jgi:hypothetical protein
VLGQGTSIPWRRKQCHQSGGTSKLSSIELRDAWPFRGTGSGWAQIRVCGAQMQRWLRPKTTHQSSTMPTAPPAFSTPPYQTRDCLSLGRIVKVKDLVVMTRTAMLFSDECMFGGSISQVLCREVTKMGMQAGSAYAKPIKRSPLYAQDDEIQEGFWRG